MHERALLKSLLMEKSKLVERNALLLLATFAGLVLTCGVVTDASAGSFTVDTLDDGVGDDVDGMRTFRWAINQANLTIDEFDTIDFDPALALLDIDDDEVLQIILTSPPPVIDSELLIVGPLSDMTGPMGENEEIFIDIVADLPAATVFDIRQTITLENVELRGDSTLINGGTPGGGNDLDLIYNIREFQHDITWQVLDRAVEVAQDGDARLVKRGSGELALLPSASDYSGGTLLVDGTLRTDTDGLVGDVQICADSASGVDEGFDSANCGNALLIFQMPGIRIDEDLFSVPRPTDGTYAGNIIGETVAGEDGRVVKIGPGQLTLTGNNDYDGGTFVLTGEVVGDLDAIQGDVEVFACPASGRITLADSSVVAECDPLQQARLTFDIATDGAYSDNLLGQGIVAKDGDGQLTFDTTQAAFRGDVEVKRGELVVESNLGTYGGSVVDEVDVVVEEAGAISGGGTIGGDLSLSGTLDLKNQVLTTGTAQINAGSKILINPSIAGGAGQLTAIDDVTADGGLVLYEFDPDAVDALETDYFTLIETGGTVTGTLAGVEGADGPDFGLALFDLTLLYNDANCEGNGNVCLQKGFSPVLEDDARSKNQREMARALDAAYLCAQNPTSAECMISQDRANDFNDVHENFAVLSSQIPDILDEIAGEEYSAFADVRAAGTARFNRSISRRFDLERSPKSKGDVEEATTNNQRNAPRSPYAATSRPQTQWMTLGARARNLQDDDDFRDYRNRRFPWRQRKREEPMPTERHAGKGGWTGWMDVHGVMGEVGGSKNVDDVDYRIYGPLFGFDYGVTDVLTVGLTAGFTRNEIKTPHSDTKGTGTTYQVGVYAAAMIGDLYITGAGRFARSDISTNRRIRFQQVDQTAKADFNASDASAFLETAYAFSLSHDILVQPVFALAYNRLHQESFEERRAGSLNLDIDSQNFDALQTTVGVRLGIFGTPEDGGYLLPQLRIAYERELLDNDRDISANFGTAGDNGEFDLTGLSLPRDRAVIGVSSEVGVSNSINLFIDYDLRAAKDLLEHSLSFGLRALW